MKFNKKQLGMIAGIGCVIVLIVLLLTMCGGDGGHQGEAKEPSSEPVEVTEEVTQVTEEATVATEETEETVEATEETTEATEETTAPTTGGNTTPGGTGGSSGTGGSDSGTSETTTPKAGSKESPYIEQIFQLPDSFTSVSVPKNGSVYHCVYGAEGSVLTIADSEAYVVYDGKSYVPDAYGIVQVPFAEPKEAADDEASTQAEGEEETPAPEQVQAPQAYYFQLGSKSKEAKTFLLSFAAPLGSPENPEMLEAVDAQIYLDATLEAGDEDGYYYGYEAETGGRLVIQLPEESQKESCDVIVTVGDAVIKLSECEDGILSVDYGAWETVLIQIVAKPEADGTYPAIQVQLQAEVVDTTGTVGNPIQIYNEFPIVTDVLEPGEEVYYSIFGANSMILTLADEDAYVLVGEEKWIAQDGVISGTVVASNPREPVLIGIGNGGETAESYTVEFTYKLGAMNNPAPLLDGQINTAVIDENATDGYWYTWTAQEDGILTIAMPEGNWMYQINHVTDGVYGEIQYSDAEDASSLMETEVFAGDELSVMVCTYDPADPFAYPAGKLSFEALFTLKPGSQENPIWLTELETEVSAAAGESVYLNQIKSGPEMKIRGEGSFTVTYDGIEYQPVDGVVTVPEVSGSRFAPVPVVITNAAEEEVKYTVIFTYPLGSMSNPHVLTDLDEYTVNVEGDGEGYIFTWTAEKDGKLTLFMDCEDWTFAVDNLTAQQYGDIHSSDDGDVTGETVSVSAGDALQIKLGTASGQNNQITVVFEFEESVLGSEKTPQVLEQLGEYTVSVTEALQEYFFSWTAQADGVLEVSMTGDDWTYTVQNLTTDTEYESCNSNQSEAAAEYPVAAGDVLLISVGTSSGESKDLTVAFDSYDPNMGTQDNPIWLTGMENTVTVRPGASVYCNIVFSNVVMTVQGQQEYVIQFDNTGYPVVSGIATVSDVDASRFMPKVLVLTNPGQQKISLTVSFVNPEGTMMNPKKITQMGQYTASVKGDGEGYFFTWIAVEDGTLTVTMLGDDWVYSISNITTGKFGLIHDSSEEGVSSDSCAVTAGDEIQINIGTASGKDQDITLTVDFQSAVLESSQKSQEPVATETEPVLQIPEEEMPQQTENTETETEEAEAADVETTSEGEQ